MRQHFEIRKVSIKVALFILFIFSICLRTNAQYYSNWFLETDSILTFNTIPPTFVKPFNNVINTKGGGRQCISNCNGEVQFYTNHQFLYNKFGDSIGDYLISDGNVGGGPSVFVPKPGNDSLYYHFYLVRSLKLSKYSDYFGELRYSEINVFANNGAGQIIKSKVVVDDSCDKMNLCLMHSSNRNNFWVMVTYDCNTVHCYKVDSSGVSSKPVVSNNVYNQTLHDVRKYYPWPNPLPNTFIVSNRTKISSSNDGNRVISWSIPEAVNNYAGSAFIYDFNQATGKLSNGKSILPFNELGSNYTSDAACFSGDDSLIYISVNPGYNNPFSGTKNYKLIQYNIKRNTRRVIRNTNNSSDAISLLAMGNNGKIYGFSSTPYDSYSGGYVSIIHYPNKVGTECNLQRPPNFPRTLKLGPTPVDQLINMHSNLEYTTCVDTVAFSLLGDSNFSKLTCHFGDGDSIVIQKPENRIYSFKHLYKTEGRFTTEWKGLTAVCGAPVWYTDTIDVKFAPRSIAKNVEIKQSPACTQSQIRLQDSVIHTTRYAIDWGDSSVQTFTVSAGVVAQMHSYLKPGVYTITVTLSNAWSCEKTYTYPITVRFLPQPQLAFSSNAAYCSGRSLQLTNDSARADDTINYNYYNFSTKGIGKEEVNIPLQYGQDTIKVYAYNEYGCSARDTLIVAVKPAVDAAFLLSKTDYCVFEIDTARRQVNVGDVTSTWHWENTVYFNSFLPIKLNTVGPQSVLHIVESKDGCRDTQNSIITVHPLPAVKISGLKPWYCTETNLELQANDTLWWYINGNFLQRGDQIVKTLIDTAMLDVMAIAISEFACTDTARGTSLVVASPTSLVAVSDSTVCFGDEVLFQAQGNGDTMHWQFAAMKATGKTWSFSVSEPQGTYLLQLIAENKGRCYDTAYRNIEVQSIPKALFTFTPACKGQSTTFTDISTGSIATRQWIIKQKSNTAATFIDSFTSVGDYPVKLKVSSSFGCSDSVTRNVRVYPMPQPRIFITGHDYDEAGKYEYYFEAIPDTFTKYEWNLGTAGTANTGKVFTAYSKSEVNEHITLTVTDKRNCTASVDTNLRVLGLTGYYFPKAFTPNNDAINEGFGIAGPEYIKKYRLHIFNRWGEKVFYTEDPQELWNPQKPVPGEYIYKAVVQDVYGRWEEIEGIVLLIR